MSKNKRNNSIYGTLYTADEYKNRKQFGTLYSADEYRDVLAKREEENRKRQEQQKQNAARAQRIVSMTNADRLLQKKYGTSNPVETMQEMQHPGWTRLQKIMKAGDQEKEEPKQPAQPAQPTNFKDWSQVAQLMDPKSKVNQLIAQRPQDEQDYWQAIRNTIKNNGMEKNGSIEQAKQKYSDDTKALLRIMANGGTADPVKDYKQAVSDWYTWRDSNLYTGNDVHNMSYAQLQQRLAQSEQKIREAEAQEAAFLKQQEEMRAEAEANKAGAADRQRLYYELSERGLPVLQNKEGENYVPDVSEWGYMDSTQFIRERPEEYEYDYNTKTEYDRMLYDAINGQGAYDAAVDEMTDEEIDQLDADMDLLWQRLEKGDFVEEAKQNIEEYQKYSREEQGNFDTDKYRREAEGYRNEIAARDRISDYEAQIQGEHPFNRDNIDYGFTLDKNYMDARNIYAAEDVQDRGIGQFAKYIGDHPVQHMTPKQLDTFNGFFEKGQYAEAMAYYNELEPYLRQIMKLHKGAMEQDLSNNGWALPMAGYRVLTKPVEGAAGAVMTGLAMLGNKKAGDPSSEYWDLARTNMNIQNASAERWGKQAAKWFGGGDDGFAARAAKMINGVMFSITDNLTAFTLSGGYSAVGGDAATKLTQGMIQLIMSSEATAGEMFSNLENGMDPTRAGILAYGSGIVEAITEKYSLEQILDPNVRELLGTKGAFMKYLGKASLAEGSEEIASDLLDTGLEYIMYAIDGHEPELLQQYKALTAEGMDPTQATWTVLGDYVKQLGSDGLAGALSGLLMSGSRGVNARIQNSNVNAQVGGKALGNNVDEKADSAAQAGQRATNLFTILETGEGFRAGTESNALAKKIRAEIREGKSINKAEVGSLVRTIAKESSDTVSSTMKSILGDAFMEELNSKGIVGDYAENARDALLNIIVNGEYDAKTLQVIAGSKAAQQILAEYKMGGYAEETQKAMDLTQQEREAQKSVMQMITEPKAETLTKDEIRDKLQGAEWLDKAEQEKIKGLTGKSTEIAIDGEAAEIVGFGAKNVEEEIDGEKKKYSVATVKLADGREVEISAVDATNKGVAQVLKFMQAEAGKSVGSNLGVTLLDVAAKAKDTAQAVTDAVNVMWSEALGIGTGKTNLDTKTEQRIREAVKKDIDAGAAARAKMMKEIRPGQGKVTLEGAAAGTKEYNAELAKLGKNIRVEAEFIAGMMKSLGMDVQMYWNPEESAKQGVYYGGEDGGIRVNLAGTYDTKGTHRSAVATVAHEGTHWLAANAPKAYQQMRSFTITNLAKNGVNVKAELRRIMDNYERHGESLDLNGAIDEMVAMGFEQVLTNEKLAAKLKTQDPETHGKLRQAVKWVVDKIREVIGSVRTTSSKYARSLMNVADEAARIWGIAYEEATGAESSEEATGEKLSLNALGLEEITSDQIYNIGTRNDTIAETEGDLLRFVHNARGSKNQSTVFLGTMNDAAKAILEQDTGMTGLFRDGKYVLGITADDIRHFDKHFKADAEVAQAILDTFGMIMNHDSAVATREKTGQVKVELKKGENSIQLLSVAKLSNAKRAVTVKTVYLTKGQIKNWRSLNRIVTLRSLRNYTRSLLRKNNVTQNSKNINSRNSFQMDELDRQYAEAVEKGDWTTAENMLLDKMQQTEGITGYRAPHFYAGEHKDIARLIKSGNQEVISSIVDDMAQHVPENAVLVPMPPHEGKVTDSTDTMILAKALSKATGAPVVVALESDYHESRYKAKAAGDRSVNAQTMGFRQVAEIPEGKMPVFIDNMVGGGQTAMAAKNAVGRGITMAYAQSSRSKSLGVKAVSVTYDQNGKLIPLSQRMDPNNKSWKYSFQDDEYMFAVNTGDMDLASRKLERAAKAAGYTDKAYHGSETFGFTEFDMKKSQGVVFVAYNSDLAGTYTNVDEVREIGKANAKNYDSMTPDELCDVALDTITTDDDGYTLIDVRLNEEESNEGWGEIYELTWSKYDEEEDRDHDWYETINRNSLISKIEAYRDKEGIYELYTRPGNQLVLNLNGENWNRIPWSAVVAATNGEAENWKDKLPYKTFLTRQIASMAKANGYDSVRINNIRDHGGRNLFSKSQGYGDIGIFFNPGDVKSADTVVYDNDGNVIPPSERFNREKTDIRWSIRDDRYMDVVNSGDMETAQWMVDQMAEAMMENSKVRGADGKLLKVFHGTNADFNVFDTSVSGGKNGTAEGYGIYLSDNPEVTEMYGDRQIGAYLNMKRPAYGDRKTIRKNELTKLIRAACEYEAKRIAEEEGYDNIKEALLDTWITGYVYTPGYSNIQAAYSEVADKILEMNHNDADIVMEIMNAMGIRDYDSAMEFYHDVLTPTTGIDGYWQKWENSENGKESNIFLAFDSSQIKEADPATYDDDGKLIPLSERFNEEKQDIRWSMRDDTDYDVRAWMETVPEWSLGTEAEKKLLGDYKSLRTKQQLDRLRMQKIDRELLNLEASLVDERWERIEAQESMENALESAGVSVRDGKWLQKDGKIIAKIETDGSFTMNKGADESAYAAMKKAGFMFNGRKVTYQAGALAAPTRADGKAPVNVLLGKSEALRQRDALNIKKQNLQTVMDQTEEKLNQILGNEGFGRMMYQQAKVLEDFAYNKTQAEVTDAVNRMDQAAKDIQARIEENRKATEALEKNDVVKRFRELLGTTTAEQTAAELKKEYSSTWTAKQIRAYLDPIILKMKTGEDFKADVETLAGILVGSDSRNTYETLSDLRGLTITLGKGAQKELKAQNSSLKEVRARLAGTGIQVKYGDRSTLEADIEDLRAEYPMIPELGDEKDALGNFLNWIDSMKSASAGMEFYDQRIAEAMAFITGKAAGAAKGIYMPNDPKAQKQVLAMMDFVKGLNAETQQAQKTLADVARQMEEMQKAGQAANTKATVLMRDVNVALDYYNKISRMAVDETKLKKTSAIVEQLKSDQAKKILENNEEWRQLIQRDAEARKELENNRKYARQVNTNLKRMWNLLKSPKGLNNIPEHMQGLAREVISMFVNNDMGHGWRFLQATQDELKERRRILDAWEKQSGKFDRGALAAMDPENVKIDTILADLDAITEGLRTLNAQRINGKNKLDSLQQRGAILEGIRDAVGEIYSAIKAEQEVQIGDRRVSVEDAAYAVAQGTQGKKYREWTGAAGQKLAMLHKFIVTGTVTPEYFFRTLGNAGLSDLWENYHNAENRNGLELQKAKEKLAQIAEEYGYKNWDMKQKITLNLESGDVEITLGQLMSLWATWQREQTLGPEMSQHLTKGGFYAEQDLREGILGRQAVEKRAHVVTEEDMNYVLTKLTVDQMNFIDAVVKFMSNDMSELGNAASMAAYGIKLYKESYYFPFQIWNGVKSRKSNDAGAAAAAQDRAFHPSFSKSRMHGAANALVIGDFMQVATDHIAGMINYATMGLANESLMKVLNQQTNADLYGTKRNTEALLEEAYGREAMQYLRELQVQLNGGAVKIEKTFYDKLISAFRKNAVAGSLSVALQQPLSYLRAAMMIDGKYLARAISPDMWKGSYKEMMAHSGVAVIKEMGRFDMNFGSSAREYLTPDGKEGKARAAWNWVADKSTMLPELMDRMTWTRMWSAVKAEQHAEHPEMDMKSDEFLDMCGVRFNDVMRRTQVYDSTLVKSANMRSQNPAMKMLTSFMAEPTLTLNVMADSFRMAIQGEKGGKTLAVKSSVIFLIGAVFQAAVKGAMGARRSPDDDKTWGENFWYRFWYNFIGEANPMQLVPGYDELITALKGGDISDDAMGTLSKLFKSVDKVGDLIGGKTDTWRGIEDSAGQIVQLFTRVPVKNLMRDMRATWNWIGTDPYAKREDSDAVLKYQFKDLFMNADNLLGVVNKKLGEAGWETSNSAYYKRIYQAKKEGREQDAADMIEYLLKGKGVKKEDSITSGVNSVAKNDKTQTPEQRLDFLMNNGGSQLGAYVAELYEKGEIDRAQAEQMYKEANPKATDKDILEALDRVDYKKEGGEDESFSNYTRMEEAMDAGDAEQVQKEKEYLLSNGFKVEDINSKMKSIYTDRYKKGEIDRSEAEAMLKKWRPDLSADDIFWTLDRIDYKNETGNDAGSGTYYRLKDAINANNSKDIRAEVKKLLDHGYDKDKIKGWIGNKSTGFKEAYLNATGNEKVKIKNALIQAYKAIGLTDSEANEIINKWK